MIPYEEVMKNQSLLCDWIGHDVPFESGVTRQPLSTDLTSRDGASVTPHEHVSGVSTSRLAYHRVLTTGIAGTQAHRILQALKSRSHTRNQLSRELGITINAVCGRIAELKKHNLIYEDLTYKDPVSGLPNGLIHLQNKEE